MIWYGKHSNIFIARIFTLVLTVTIPICHCIRLEYRPSLDQLFTYSEVKVIEVVDPDNGIDYSIERIETIYTERIVDIDESNNGLITIEIEFISVDLVPPDKNKEADLLSFQERYKVNRQGMLQNTLVSAAVGDLKNFFPLHDITVGQSWTTTANGLASANSRYTLS